MIGKDSVAFWQRLDDIRAAALSGDRARATRMAADLGARHLIEDNSITRGRRDMLAELARRLDLDFTAPVLRPEAEAPGGSAAPRPSAVTSGTLFEGDLPEITPGGAPGISLVTCCMNREENLLRALQSWLACPELNEIVIVDWSSDRPVQHALAEQGIRDPRLRLVRAEGEPRWILSFAFNAGFRVARHAQILKADADIVLDPTFFARNRLESGEFIAGNWRKVEEGQSHVNGFFLAHKADLAAVAGFNEHITTYGWDDDDLYDRLETHGAVRRDVAPGTIFHLPHSDAERTGPPSETSETSDARPDARPDARTELGAEMLHKIRANRALAYLMPYWDRGKRLVPFQWAPLDGESGPPPADPLAAGHLLVQRKSWLPHPVPAHIQADVSYFALWELASWRLGQRALHLDRDWLDLVLSRPLADLGPLDVEVALSEAGDDPRTALAADGGYVVVTMGAEGLGTGPEVTAAFEALADLAARADLALVLSGPFPRLPGADDPGLPARARACPVVARWHPMGNLEPVDIAALRRPAASARRRFLRLDWSEANRAALIDMAQNMAKTPVSEPVSSPALAPVRSRIFVDAQHGLGNRMRAIASAAAIAARADRELVVVWQADAHCDCRLGDLFDYKGALIEESFLEAAPARGCRVYNYMEVEPGAQKNAPLALEGDSDLYLRSAYVFNSPLTSWEAENAHLRALTPVAAVRDLVASVRHPNDVSAHVRMAGGAGYDHLPYEALENWTEEGHQAIAYWREKSHFSHFLTRLDALSREGRAARIFLAADAPETYEAFRAVYGDRLAMLERPVYDRSAEQLRYALADAILLGQAPLLLGSTWSSFSELALRMSPLNPQTEMSGTDF